MPENPNITEGQTPINLDEIEPDSLGAPENGDPEAPECDESPSGQHEFDVDEEAGNEVETCVYCGIEKGQD